MHFLMQKPTSKTQHTCQQELYASMRCSKYKFLIVQGENDERELACHHPHMHPHFKTSHRLSNNSLRQSSGDIRAKHKLASNLGSILSDLSLYPSAQLSPKISPSPEKRTTLHLREKWHFIFVSSTQISGCITRWVGVKPQEHRKGKMLACWLWNNS